MIETHRLEFQTKGENDMIRITEDVQRLIGKSSIEQGSALLFLQSTTSSLIIIENEQGLFSDLRNMLERTVPRNASYEHEKAWHDGNGHSHMRSSLMGQSLILPISDGNILLGQWQEIFLLEFDIRPRTRTLIVQLQGV
jgi:secondary thiamine-phosphate synthase enzyme